MVVLGVFNKYINIYEQIFHKSGKCLPDVESESVS